MRKRVRKEAYLEMIVIGYIDPGTGSMLFTIFIGVITSGIFLAKKLALKLKFLLHGGKVEASKERYPYVIFSDSKRYWNVFKPICDEFEKREEKLEYLTASSDDPALAQEYKYVNCRFIGENNKAYARLNMLDAGILLSTTPGLDVYQWKRSENVSWYAHIFHAVDEGLGYRMFGMDYYDAILLTGEFQGENIRKLEKIRNLPSKELAVVGSTYMDALKEKLDENPTSQKTNENKTILLAPSWGESGILSKYGDKIIKALCETGYQIIVRPHPQSLISEKNILDGLVRRFENIGNLEWNYDNDNFEVLKKADVMITDFSGIIFDYALVFGKPVIYADTSFDSAPYDAAWIDGPLWRFEVLKEIGAPLKPEDFADMKAKIDDLIDSEKFDAARDKVRNEAWQCIGESAQKTVDYMINKYQELSLERG